MKIWAYPQAETARGRALHSNLFFAEADKKKDFRFNPLRLGLRKWNGGIIRIFFKYLIRIIG